MLTRPLSGISSPSPIPRNKRHVRDAIAEDPNGLAVGLMSQVEKEHRSPPTLP